MPKIALISPTMITQKSNNVLKTKKFTNIRNNVEHSTKSVLVGTALALATLVPLKANCVESKSVELTNIENTSSKIDKTLAEFLDYTHLNNVQWEALKDVMNTYLNELYKGKANYYFKGLSKSFMGATSIDFTNGIDVKDFSYCNPPFGDIGPHFHYKKSVFKVENKEDGSFTIITKIAYKKEVGLISSITKYKVDRLNYTKDGQLISINNTPKKQPVKNNINIEDINPLLLSDVENVEFFNDYDSNLITRFAQALGLNSIESANKKDANILFFNSNNHTFRLNVKKTENDNNTIIGIANKVNDRGLSEIYLVKGEILSTNRSDKLIVSKMKVVQDGLGDDAPTSKKDLKVTTKKGNNKTTSKHKADGVAHTPWLANFFSLSHNKFYEGEISSETLNEIDEIMTESNADGKTVKIISIDKTTGKVSVQGQ